MPKSKEDIHPIDLHVGSRIKARAKSMRITQKQLGVATGVTMQQVQKQMAGTNRVSASALYLMAKALNVSVSHFFEGLEPEMDDTPLDSFMEMAKARTVIEAYLNVPIQAQESLLNLMQVIGGQS